jgi:hypothetical protein
MSIIKSKDDVLTALIHLGYLTYDWNANECYVPNREVEGELVKAVTFISNTTYAYKQTKSTKHGDNHIIDGINYHAESKKHECKIERHQM